MLEKRIRLQASLAEIQRDVTWHHLAHWWNLREVLMLSCLCGVMGGLKIWNSNIQNLILSFALLVPPILTQTTIELYGELGLNTV
jgi:hypothetical protein